MKKVKLQIGFSFICSHMSMKNGSVGVRNAFNYLVSYPIWSRFNKSRNCFHYLGIVTSANSLLSCSKNFFGFFFWTILQAGMMVTIGEQVVN